MKRRLLTTIVCTVVLLNLAQPALAQVAEDSGKKQSAAQVLVTIGLCAIALKALNYFKIP